MDIRDKVKREVKTHYDVSAAQFLSPAPKRPIQELFAKDSPTRKYFRRRKVETALRLGRFKPGGHLLEVGTQFGQYAHLLAQQGFQVLGVDVSPKSIEVAQAHVDAMGIQNVRYQTADAEDMHRLPSNAFDGVISFSTLRYVPRVREAVKEIHRVTKPGGRAVIDFPNRMCPWFKILKRRFGVEEHIHDHLYSADEVRALMENAGFKEVEVRKALFTHYTFPDQFLSLYELWDFLLERTPLIKEMAAILLVGGLKV